MALGLWYLIRDRFLKKALIRVASVNVYKSPAEVRKKPYVGSLTAYGRELGWEMRNEEDGPTYAKRVFGVDEVEMVGPSTTN